MSFFAYPGVPSDLVPADCNVVRLAERREDVVGALEALAEAVDAAPTVASLAGERRPELGDVVLDTRGAAAAIASVLPEGAIVAVDSGGGGAAADPVSSPLPTAGSI